MPHFCSTDNKSHSGDAESACLPVARLRATRGQASVTQAGCRALEVRVSPHFGGPTGTFRLRYSHLGDLATSCHVVLGGISASESPDLWWGSQVGSGRAIDPADGAVLGIEYIGAAPDGWKGISTFDQAAAVAAVLDELGVEQVDAFIGASYGGCVGLAFAIRYPSRVKRVLAISASHRPSPMTTALRAIQRNILRKGLREQDLPSAIALARALAMTTYRTEEEFAQRFDDEPDWDHDHWRFPVEDYLEARGSAFADSFDARRYLALSESLDLHRIDPDVLNVPLRLLAVKQDRLIPQRDISELAEATGASLKLISSRYGHDAFLKEEEAVAHWLRGHMIKQKRTVKRMTERVAPA